MRDDEAEDPKKPEPVWIPRQRSNPADGLEAIPCRKDDESERRRHV